MKPLLVAFGAEDAAARLGIAIDAEPARITVRRFPDGETYVRFDSAVEGRDVVILADLSRPDDKIIPVLWIAATARDLGAIRVGLVAPYLPYMRQDARFQAGEGITSRYFAALASSHVDWLVTVDPHLHRYRALDELYTIPTRVVGAAPLLAEWIGTHIHAPLLVGPDAESQQWVSAVAGKLGAPSVVLAKTRVNDREVRVSIADVDAWRDRTPVLVDDVISTGGTMVETVRSLVKTGMPGPVCVAVHGIFVGTAHDELIAAGCRRVVTCNTVPNPTSEIDATALLAEGVRDVMRPPSA
ncbi:MAG: ribose-phosphate pyrophosphokinase [Nitrospirota bacterium]